MIESSQEAMGRGMGMNHISAVRFRKASLLMPIAAMLCSCAGSSSSGGLSPLDAAIYNYAQAVSNAENASIASYRPYLRQSDIDQCHAQEEAFDIVRQGTQRLLFFDSCLSAAAHRNQGR